MLVCERDFQCTRHEAEGVLAVKKDCSFGVGQSTDLEDSGEVWIFGFAEPVGVDGMGGSEQVTVDHFANLGGKLGERERLWLVVGQA